MFAQKIEVLLCLFYAAGLLPEWADVDEFGAGPGKAEIWQDCQGECYIHYLLVSLAIHYLYPYYPYQRSPAVCLSSAWDRAFIWSLNPFIRFTAHITEIQEVLKERNSVRYEQTMVTKRIKGLDYNCVKCFVLNIEICDRCIYELILIKCKSFMFFKKAYTGTDLWRLHLFNEKSSRNCNNVNKNCYSISNHCFF